MIIEASAPYFVSEIEHIEIPLADGCRLAARIWMPEDAHECPRPAVLEYIPYRKNDLTLRRDEEMHPWVAARGYACVRVDLRGSGESEGILRDEYLQQELDDGVEVIQWLARQPWCDGNVGMIGISWGGFNGLQIAAMAPPELKAIITCCSSDDRYADDVHYMGGCLLTENLSWASIMFARNTCPPDPRLVGDRWRDMWMQRLHGSGLWLETWLEHQCRDDYWRHGSVCEDFSQIQAAVYAVSGWADGYCNSVFRLLEGLPGPRKGLVGPWAHTYPHVGKPGPAIDFARECTRWWDYWLKGIDTGIMDEPMLHAWMQDGVRPQGGYDVRPGRWVNEKTWPSPRIEQERLLPCADHTLVFGDDRRTGAALRIQSPLTVGFHGGKWCSYARPGDQPVDQRSDDSGSLVFETAPLDEPLEILGQAVAELTLVSDRPVAMVAVRLNDVARDGAVTRVTYGLLNLTHREGHAEPVALQPGHTYRVRVPLKHVAQTFARGHRLRLAISNTYWPIAWPSPEATTLTLHVAGSSLELPIRATDADEAPELPESFAPPAESNSQEASIIEPAVNHWHVHHELDRDVHSLDVDDGFGTVHHQSSGLTITREGREHYCVNGGDPQSARGETRSRFRFVRDGWSVETRTETVLTADREAFRLRASLRAFENDEECHEQTWDRIIPRRGL